MCDMRSTNSSTCVIQRSHTYMCDCKTSPHAFIGSRATTPTYGLGSAWDRRGSLEVSACLEVTHMSVWVCECFCECLCVSVWVLVLKSHIWVCECFSCLWITLCLCVRACLEVTHMSVWMCKCCTARSVEDETRNDRRDANRNPEWWGDFSQLQI